MAPSPLIKQMSRFSDRTFRISFALISLVALLLLSFGLAHIVRSITADSITEHAERENLTFSQDYIQRHRELLRDISHSDSQREQTQEVLIGRLLAGTRALMPRFHITDVTLFRTDGRVILQTQDKGTARVSDAYLQQGLGGKTIHLTGQGGDGIPKGRVYSYIPFYPAPDAQPSLLIRVSSDVGDTLHDLDHASALITTITALIIGMSLAALYLYIEFSQRLLNSKHLELEQTLQHLERSKAALQERTNTLTISNDILEKEIGERIDVERRLRDSENYLQSVLDHSFSAILTIDDQGLIASANQAALKLLGTDPATLKGQPLATLFAPVPEGPPPELGELAELVGETHEYLFQRADQSTFPAELALTAMPYERHQYWVVVLHDLSQRKAAEQIIEATRQQGFHREKMASVGTLAAGIVHEISNPITAISGMIQNLRQPEYGRPLSADELAQFDMVEEQIRRINQITRDVSEFSTPNGERIEWIDLNNLVGRTIRLLRHDQRMQAINIRLDLDPNLPAIEAQSDKITQVLLNLTHNAADALTDIDDPQIVIRSQLVEGQVTLSVSDNGPGMPTKTLEHASEAFFTTKPPGIGMGMGLFLCDQILNSLGGRLEIESELQKGTIASALLPVESGDR